MSLDSGSMVSVCFGAKLPLWWLFLPLLWYSLLPMAQGTICDATLSSGGHQVVALGVDNQLYSIPVSDAYLMVSPFYGGHALYDRTPESASGHRDLGKCTVVASFKRILAIQGEPTMSPVVIHIFPQPAVYAQGEIENEQIMSKNLDLRLINSSIEGIILAVWIAILIGRGFAHPKALWWCAVMTSVSITQSVCAESNSTIKECCPCDSSPHVIREIILPDFEESEDQTTVGPNIGIPPHRVAVYAVASVVFCGGFIILVIAVVERKYGVFLQFVPIEKDGEGKSKKMKRFSTERKKVRKIKNTSLEAKSGLGSSTGSNIEGEALKRKRRDSD